jgi:hypothetical protein
MMHIGYDMKRSACEYLAQIMKLSHILFYDNEECSEIQTYLTTFLDEVAYHKEKQMMIQFREKNGFDAIDDNAKRALLYEICNQIDYPYPTTDEERNEIIQMGDSTEWTDMMRIGWKPMY